MISLSILEGVALSLYAIRFDVSFTPREVIDVPGFSVKFLKSLFISYDSEGLIKSLLLSGGANKPIQLSPIMLGDRAILSTGNVKLRVGTNYWFRLGFVGDESKVSYISDLINDVVERFAELLSIDVVTTSLEVFSSAPKEFTIKVLTPAIIKAKDSTLVRYPTLKELISSPLRVLGRVLWERYTINIPTTWAWRISAYYIMTESQSRSSKVDLGDGRVVEGVTGVWSFKKIHKMPKYLESVLSKALAVAESVGIGKSRAIGFGVTSISHK